VKETDRVGALSVVSAENACEKGIRSNIKNADKINFISRFPYD
jgi:hypothetical protein